MFGRNRAVVDAAAPSHGERLEESSVDGADKPKEMLELPDVVFRLLCRFLEFLLHFVFGRNRAVVDAAAPSRGERLEEAVEDGAEKPKAMQELPDVVFRLVCRFLE